MKLHDASTAAESLGEHLAATSGALGQSRARLTGRAVCAVELWWNRQVARGEPDPLAADIVHVREDCRNGSRFVLAGRLKSPGGAVEVLDHKLIHAIAGGKDLDGGSAELSVTPGLTLRHDSRRHDLSYVRNYRPY